MKRTFEFPGLRYPRSFLKLLLLGFGLVSLPLILALLNATAYVDRLTTQSQAAVAFALRKSESGSSSVVFIWSYCHICGSVAEHSARKESNRLNGE